MSVRSFRRDSRVTLSNFSMKNWTFHREKKKILIRTLYLCKIAQSSLKYVTVDLYANYLWQLELQSGQVCSNVAWIYVSYIEK